MPALTSRDRLVTALCLVALVAACVVARALATEDIDHRRALSEPYPGWSFRSGMHRGCRFQRVTTRR